MCSSRPHQKLTSIGHRMFVPCGRRGCRCWSQLERGVGPFLKGNIVSVHETRQSQAQPHRLTPERCSVSRYT